MNWKQNLADYFGWKNFEDMDTSDQRTAEKAVELYQKELNEKLKNVGLSVSELDESQEDKEEREKRYIPITSEWVKKTAWWKEFMRRQTLENLF